MHPSADRRLLPLLLAACLCWAPAVHAVELLDRIAAIVDDDVVMASDVDNRQKEIEAQVAARGAPMPPREQLRKQVLDRLVLESIQFQLATRTGVRIDDETLNGALAGIAKQNGMELGAFIDRLQSEGLDYPTFREQVRRDMAINRLRQRRVGDRVRVTDADVDDFLRSAVGRDMFAASYHIAHILIAVPETATADIVKAASDKAAKVLAEAKAGASFSDLAVRYSDAADALEGGDLGWRNAAQLPTIFAGVVDGLQKGDTAGPLRSGAGFHIVRLVDRKGDQQRVEKQAKTRHILVKTSAIRSADEAKALLATLRNRIVQGEDFATLAKGHSEDPGSALSGGDLGWVSPGQMVEDFEKVMNATAVGAVSPVFESQFGFHVLQVLERRDQDTSEEYRRLQARNALWKRKYDVEVENWLREIRNEAYVDLKNPG